MTKHLLLQSLGFNAKSEKVYRALLSLADAPVSAIASKSGQKRTSTYHILADLEQRGLVGSYQNKGRKRYFAEHPGRLTDYFQHQSILSERILPILQADIRENNSRVKLRSVSGQRGIVGIIEDSLHCKNKEILSIGSSRLLLEYLGANIAFGERRRRLGIAMRSLRFEADHSQRGKNRLQELRFLSKEMQLPGYVMIYDDVVDFILYENEGVGIIIESKTFAEMMRKFFEAMWFLGREGSKTND